MRKLFKKSLACVLTAIICVSLCVAVVPASAEGNITYSTNEIVAKAGETVDIDFSVSNFADVKGAIIKFFLPEVVASITEVKLNGEAIAAYDATSGAGYYQVNGNAIKFLSLFGYEGELASRETLTFNVKAVIADTAVDGTYEYPAPEFQIANETTLLDVTGEFAKFEIKNACEHTWGDWAVVVAATDKANGSKSRACTICGETETAVIPRNIKINTINLALANNIKVNLYVNADHFTTYGYTNPYMVIIVNGKEIVLGEEDYEIEADGRYKFILKITPQMLNDEMNITLYAENNGETYTFVRENYRVASYCYNQLGKSTVAASMKKLIVDTLEYATALQLYKGHNTANLANADLTEAQKAMATAVSYKQSSYAECQNLNYAVKEGATATWKSAALVLGDSIKVNLTAELPADISNIKVVATNGISNWEISSADFIYDSAKGRYTIPFEGLAAHQLDDAIQYTIYDGDEIISNTLLYSVENYVYRNIESTQASHVALRDVYARMMNYGRSAQAAN